jgi:putative copper export protein
MLWTIRQIVLAIHIFLAILWVGGVLFVGWGVFPATRFLAFETQRQLFIKLMGWTHWLFTFLGIGVIGTGVLLGTVFGPLSSWNDVLSTTYGNIWLTALIVGVFTLLWGIVFGYRYSMSVFNKQSIWDQASNGDTKPLFKSLAKLAAVESVEGIGFIVLIFLMVSL